MIQEVVDLLGTGVSIGQVKGQIGRGRTPPVAGSEPEGDAWHGYQQRMLLAVERFDEPGLEAAYSEALALYPVDVVTERLVNPLLRALGERWEKRRGGIAEEHSSRPTCATSSAPASITSHPAGPDAATRGLPTREHHELGLLLFCLQRPTTASAS